MPDSSSLPRPTPGPLASPGPVLLCEVTRGGTVESRHFGHAVVVDRTGTVVWAAGNPEHTTFPRSSLKPLQALAGIMHGIDRTFGLTAAEVAVICASHSAEPRHREAVARVLAKIGAMESDLHCGPHPVSHLPSRDELIRAGKEPTAIYNNCSGKHSGMLALARNLGAPLTGYWEADHPVQREIQRVLADACDADLSRLTFGTDGCGVPTYLLSLRQLALGFARMAAPESLPDAGAEAAQRITSAMNAEPEMVRGEGGFDSVLMRALPGVLFSKGGAEGCQCVGILRQGLGIAIKVEDGAARPLAPLMLAILQHQGVLGPPVPETLQELQEPEVPNTRGEVVGTIRACLQ